jgi:protein SCO1/2
VSIIRKVVAITAVAAVALSLAGCGKDKEAKQLSGLQLTPPPTVVDQSLPDASNGGAEFPFSAAKGRFLLVYFGYTQCPDVCPTTFAEIKKALKHVGDNAKNVDVAMITIDPKRDSGELLTNYVQSFVSGSHALRTDDDTRLKAVAKAFGAGYTVTTNAKGTVEVTHSANVYVVDSTGKVVLEWPFGLLADAMATDMEILFGAA